MSATASPFPLWPHLEPQDRRYYARLEVLRVALRICQRCHESYGEWNAKPVRLCGPCEAWLAQSPQVEKLGIAEAQILR